MIEEAIQYFKPNPSSRITGHDKLFVKRLCGIFKSGRHHPAHNYEGRTPEAFCHLLKCSKGFAFNLLSRVRIIKALQDFEEER